ncbi:acyl-CoA thioesterase domain-containing protein [Novosphingobium sp.]|uniref:acyl-CoA thioesterase domain-containing protein n=1 Tax=Novosphingobium sp. TaxID=1874826 RepID=UPI002601B91E|nr:acyl-CoA thioesterase domain-containing protein [Novosphingobium sp.]
MDTLSPDNAITHLFDKLDGAFVPTALATGPWDKRMQSGVVINALVAHAAEQTPSLVPMVTSRLVTDILKPAWMAPVQPRVEVIREGTRLQLLQIELLQNDAPIVRASALRVRIAECPATPFPVHAVAPEGLPSLNRRRSAMNAINETRLEAGGLDVIGPGLVWSRMRGEIEPGMPISPFVHTAMAADMGSGTSSYVDWHDWTYANVDISLHLTRMPQGEWIRVAATTESAGNGLAVVDTRLADEHGEFGHAHQTLFLNRTT